MVGVAGKVSTFISVELADTPVLLEDRTLY